MDNSNYNPEEEKQKMQNFYINNRQPIEQQPSQTTQSIYGQPTQQSYNGYAPQPAPAAQSAPQPQPEAQPAPVDEELEAPIDETPARSKLPTFVQRLFNRKN